MKRMINRRTTQPKKQYFSTLIHTFSSKNHHKSSQRVQGYISFTKGYNIYRFDAVE